MTYDDAAIFIYNIFQAWRPNNFDFTAKSTFTIDNTLQVIIFHGQTHILRPIFFGQITLIWPWVAVNFREINATIDSVKCVLTMVYQ